MVIVEGAVCEVLPFTLSPRMASERYQCIEHLLPLPPVLF